MCVSISLNVVSNSITHSVSLYTAAWLFLDETLHRKKKKPYDQDGLEQSDESSTPSQSIADSGIEMAVANDPSTVTLESPSSDTLGDGVNDGLGDGVNGLGDGVKDGLGDGIGDGLGDGVNDGLGAGVKDGLGDGIGDGLDEGLSDDELIMVESDVDTDSDFGRISSNTDLLIRERREEPALKKLACPNFNPLYLCLLIKKRIMDCIETPIVMVTYLLRASKRGSWSPQKLTSEDVSLKAVSVLNRVKKSALLIVDLRVFLGTLLYGLFAVIGIMASEVCDGVIVGLASGHGQAHCMWLVIMYPSVSSCPFCW